LYLCSSNYVFELKRDILKFKVKKDVAPKADGISSSISTHIQSQLEGVLSVGAALEIVVGDVRGEVVAPLQAALQPGGRLVTQVCNTYRSFNGHRDEDENFCL
jgi:hypothetical protein